jgi:hypothetical protein
MVNGLNERYGRKLIASFGPARLILRPDGRAELRGGSDSERAEAKEWISLFMHDTVLRAARGIESFHSLSAQVD